MQDKLVEKVKVTVRLRPLIEEELMSKDRSVCVETIDTTKNMIIIKKDFEKRQFQFDAVFDPKSTQQQVYNHGARDVVESVIRGFNGTIFCYGQTGTGKTYTMLGQPETEDRGIIPRSFEHIFADINKDPTCQYSIQLGYMQIYMEMLMDLIRPDNQDIKIRECPDSGVFVAGIEWVDVENTQECLSLLNFAEKNRMVAFTNLNAHSSRSHTILMVRVDKKAVIQHSRSMTMQKKTSSKNSNLSQQLPDYDDESNSLSQCVGTLYLVDLAGSERVKKSRATGDRLSEARSINYSLTALGKCIHALTGPKQFVPFRDSKLTRILQDSLGGNCKTALVVNIGPAGKHVEETLSSLIFGSRAMKIQNTPQINLNRDIEISITSQQLQQEIEYKDEQINKLEKSQSKLVAQVAQLTKEVHELKNGHLMRASNSEQENYKNKLERMEEEHKTFLEEIDTIMVEQEQDNDNLKKQVDQLQIQLHKQEVQQDELEKQMEIYNQEKTELVATIQDLHALVEQKEKENIKLKQNTNANTNTVQIGKLDKQNNHIQDLYNKNREKQSQAWRSELQQMTSQYVNLLEEKKRAEYGQNIKENKQIIDHQNNYHQKMEEMTLAIRTLKEENGQLKEANKQYMKNNQGMNDQMQQINQEAEAITEELKLQIKSMEKANGEMSKRLETLEQKIKKQKGNQEESEYFWQQELKQKNDHITIIEKEYHEIQMQLDIIKEQYQTIQHINNGKLKQQQNEIQTLNARIEELQNHNQSMKYFYQSDQPYVNEQNFELELKKSIAVSGFHEGQMIVDLQGNVNELESALRSQQAELQELQQHLKQKESELHEANDQIQYLEKQLNDFSSRSKLSINRMEEAMNQEVVRNVLEKIVLQVEINLLDLDDMSSKALSSDLKLHTRSFSKQDNTQLVESLFINSRRSYNPIEEVQEEESELQESDEKYQLPKFSMSGNKEPTQFKVNKSREDSMFSFSEKQQKKEFVSLYEDELSEIGQQSQQSMKNSNDDISFQINFNDADAVDKFMAQIKKRQISLLQNGDLSVGSIQQATSPKVYDNPSDQKQFCNNDINVQGSANEELQNVIRQMATFIVEKNHVDSSDAKQLFRTTLVDFNNLCNTLTQHFL